MKNSAKGLWRGMRLALLTALLSLPALHSRATTATAWFYDKEFRPGAVTCHLWYSSGQDYRTWEQRIPCQFTGKQIEIDGKYYPVWMCEFDFTGGPPDRLLFNWEGHQGSQNLHEQTQDQIWMSSSKIYCHSDAKETAYEDLRDFNPDTDLTDIGSQPGQEGLAAKKHTIWFCGQTGDEYWMPFESIVHLWGENGDLRPWNYGECMMQPTFAHNGGQYGYYYFDGNDYIQAAYRYDFWYFGEEPIQFLIHNKTTGKETGIYDFHEGACYRYTGNKQTAEVDLDPVIIDHYLDDTVTFWFADTDNWCKAFDYSLGHEVTNPPYLTCSYNGLPETFYPRPDYIQGDNEWDQTPVVKYACINGKWVSVCKYTFAVQGSQLNSLQFRSQMHNDKAPRCTAWMPVENDRVYWYAGNWVETPDVKISDLTLYDEIPAGAEAATGSKTVYVHLGANQLMQEDLWERPICIPFKRNGVANPYSSLYDTSNDVTQNRYLQQKNIKCVFGLYNYGDATEEVMSGLKEEVDAYYESTLKPYEMTELAPGFYSYTIENAGEVDDFLCGYYAVPSEERQKCVEIATPHIMRGYIYWLDEEGEEDGDYIDLYPWYNPQEFDLSLNQRPDIFNCIFKIAPGQGYDTEGWYYYRKIDELTPYWRVHKVPDDFDITPYSAEWLDKTTYVAYKSVETGTEYYCTFGNSTVYIVQDGEFVAVPDLYSYDIMDMPGYYTMTEWHPMPRYQLFELTASRSPWFDPTHIWDYVYDIGLDCFHQSYMTYDQYKELEEQYTARTMPYVYLAGNEPVTGAGNMDPIRAKEVKVDHGCFFVDFEVSEAMPASYKMSTANVDALFHAIAAEENLPETFYNYQRGWATFNQFMVGPHKLASDPDYKEWYDEHVVTGAGSREVRVLVDETYDYDRYTQYPWRVEVSDDHGMHEGHYWMVMDMNEGYETVSLLDFDPHPHFKVTDITLRQETLSHEEAREIHGFDGTAFRGAAHAGDALFNKVNVAKGTVKVGETNQCVFEKEGYETVFSIYLDDVEIYSRPGRPEELSVDGLDLTDSANLAVQGSFTKTSTGKKFRTAFTYATIDFDQSLLPAPEATAGTFSNIVYRASGTHDANEPMVLAAAGNVTFAEPDFGDGAEYSWYPDFEIHSVSYDGEDSEAGATLLDKEHPLLTSTPRHYVGKTFDTPWVPYAEGEYTDANHWADYVGAEKVFPVVIDNLEDGLSKADLAGVTHTVGMEMSVHLQYPFLVYRYEKEVAGKPRRASSESGTAPAGHRFALMTTSLPLSIETAGVATGVEEITGDNAADLLAEPEYYTVDGIRVPASKLGHGVYIERRGSKSRKVMM